jgi:hypothetical protein
MLIIKSKIDRGYLDVAFDFSDGAIECVTESMAANLAARLWMHLGDGRVRRLANDGPRKVHVVCDAGDYIRDDSWLTKLLAHELKGAVRETRARWQEKSARKTHANIRVSHKITNSCPGLF